MTTSGTIEGLESRRLMSAADGANVAAGELDGGQGGVYRFHYEAGGGSGVVTTEDGRTVNVISGTILGGENSTIIRYAGDGFTFYAGGGVTGGRLGVFDLPTIRADGSSHLVGTPEDDVIVVEAVTGFHEDTVEGQPADGERDILNLIDPTNGRRYVTSGGDLADPGQIQSSIDALQGFVDDDVEWIEAWRITDAENGNDAHAEQIVDTQALMGRRLEQINRLKQTRDLAVDGRFIKYTLAGVYDYYVQVVDGSPSIPRVTVDAGAGSDTVTISPNVPMKATVYGGSGGDTITTGKRQTNVFAGGGKDKLVNRSTKGAVLDGGQAADRYYNNAAADVQVLGRNDGDVVVAPGSTFAVRQTLFVRPMPIYTFRPGTSFSLRSVFSEEGGRAFLRLETSLTSDA